MFFFADFLISGLLIIHFSFLSYNIKYHEKTITKRTKEVAREMWTMTGSWFQTFHFQIGIFLFTLSFIINQLSDHILLNLRKEEERAYKIPFGGLFKWISCPNHFGEIIEWAGFAIMAWSLSAFSFAIWTAANLIPRALSHHHWYRARFEDYPEERKAALSFLW